MNYFDEFKDLLPDELETIKNIIDIITQEVVNLRITNLKYQVKNKNILCPVCESEWIVKNGFKNGTQRYKCKTCNKFFSISTNSLTRNLKLSYNQLLDFMMCLLNYNTINETSKLVGLSVREAYNIRIKILSILSNYSNQKLHGVVQCDEKYIRLSFKGTRKDKMPRQSRKNGFDNRTSGISNDQVCILMAIDSYDNIFIKVVGLGPLSTEELENNFANMIEEKSILVTDSKSSYIKFAKNHNLTLKQIPPDKHTTKDGYHLGELNSLMSELDVLLSKCRGLSTRHLQDYLELFKFRKILRYTIDYLKQNKEMYIFSLLQYTTLKTRNVCTKNMPVDVSKNYDKIFK